MYTELQKKVAAIRSSVTLGCSGAHKSVSGEWMPCASLGELLHTVFGDEVKSRITPDDIRTWRSRRKKRGRRRTSDNWEKLRQRGVMGIDTLPGGGLVSAITGGSKPPITSGYQAPSGMSVKSIQPMYSPRDDDDDVFTNIESARRRSRQLGCIGVSRRISKSGKTVWMPCTNMSDYARLTGTTALGRRHMAAATRGVVRTVVREELKRRKKSIFEELSNKSIGRRIGSAARSVQAFDPNAIDGDEDGLVQDGSPFERPAIPKPRGMSSSSGPKNNPIKELLDNPSLDKSTEEIGEIFLGTPKPGAKRNAPSNNPQFYYDFQTGKPVEILGSRVDPNIDAILESGEYRIPPGNVYTYGPGANFGLDGDIGISEAYGLPIEMMDSEKEAREDRRLIAKVKLNNPFVYNVGIKRVDPEADYTDMSLDRDVRIATPEERLEEIISQLGGKEKIKSLVPRARQIFQKIKEDTDSGEENLGDKTVRETLDRLEAGDFSLDIDNKTLNYLVRAAGYDGIVRLAYGHHPGDGTHVTAFDSQSVELLGTRQTFSEKTISDFVKTLTERRARYEAWLKERQKEEKQYTDWLKSQNIDKDTAEARAEFRKRQRENLERLQGESIETYDPSIRDRGMRSFSIGNPTPRPRSGGGDGPDRPKNPFRDIGGKAMGKIILDRVKPEHKNKKGKRTFFMIGGTTGAGKGRVLEQHLQKQGLVPGDDQAAHIDPDFIKLGLPGYDDGRGASRVHHTSRVATDHVIKDAASQGMDMIVEGTGKRDEHPRGAKNRGERVVAHFVHTPSRIASQRAMQRQRETGRDIPDYSALIASEIPPSLWRQFSQGLIDEFYLWDNENENEPPKLIVSKAEGEPMKILDRKKWVEFSQGEQMAEKLEQAANRPTSSW